MIIKCVVIDDEPLALDVLEEYIEKIHYLHLVQKCESALNAIEVIQKEKPDLIFLDIQMPELSGIDLLKVIQTNSKVIFTTAYEKYAVKSYDLEVVDYLLKPISFERFLKSVNKAIKIIQTEINGNVMKVEDITDRFLFVNTTSSGIIRVQIQDIIYIKGLKDYIEIYLKHDKIITRQSLKTISEQLASENFIQVHKSFIVQLGKIESIMGNRIKIEDHSIPIGQVYRHLLLSVIEAKKLGK